VGRMIGRALDIDPSPDHAAALRRSHEERRLMESPKYRDGAEHVITGSRAEGKTTLALRWLQEAPAGIKRVLIVRDERMAEMLRKDLGWKAKDDRILSFRRLRSGQRQDGVQYGVDETLHILAELLGIREVPHLVTVGTAADWQQ
jgi:hypothetical protein